MTSLDGYVVAITGASAGIGRAATRLLASRGAKVVAGARRSDRLSELAAEFPTLVVPIEMDVRVPGDGERLIAAATEAFGRIDGLVANAGIGLYGGILDHSDADLTRMLETNIAGTVWPVRAAVRRMLPQGSGDIVIISSVAGTSGRANEAVYAATKHAQMGLANGLDRELHRAGIRVTALCPGGVVTEFAMQPGAGRTPQTPELVDMLTAEDVAEAIAFTLGQPRTARSLIVRLRGATEED